MKLVQSSCTPSSPSLLHCFSALLVFCFLFFTTPSPSPKPPSVPALPRPSPEMSTLFFTNYALPAPPNPQMLLPDSAVPRQQHPFQHFPLQHQHHLPLYPPYDVSHSRQQHQQHQHQQQLPTFAQAMPSSSLPVPSQSAYYVHFSPNATDSSASGAVVTDSTYQPTETRSKMKRFRLTHAQTRFLLAEFARQPHPNAALRERLAAEIPGLSPRQLQVWFQNRRAKMRRMSIDEHRPQHEYQLQLQQQFHPRQPPPQSALQSSLQPSLQSSPELPSLPSLSSLPSLQSSHSLQQQYYPREEDLN
ncbi:uncharacterized protein V2V93DRAFT_374745 [Kockiozyma suomiensis]|uniref:uncharacterized protein n=1 Tax=Kockiozyma suomiensis TaxID=1337062 RepID=UPI0033433E9C